MKSPASDQVEAAGAELEAACERWLDAYRRRFEDGVNGGLATYDLMAVLKRFVDTLMTQYPPGS